MPALNTITVPAFLLSLATGVSPVLGDTPVIELETVGLMSNKNQAAWWSPIAHDAVSGTTYVSYLVPTSAPDDTDDHVYVAARDSGGNWTHSDTGGLAYFDRGHTQTSLAIDGTGQLQVFYGMHHNPIKYRASDQTGSITEGFNYKPGSEAFTGNSYTYPNLTTAPDGTVYMIIRDSSYGRLGDGKLFQYDSAHGWSERSTFAAEDDSTVYPDQVYADANGDLHIIWEWAAGGPQGTRHLGSYTRYNPSTDTYYKADGSAYLSAPFTTETADVFQPLEGGETYERGVHGFQSAKMTVDDVGNPMIAYAYSTNQQSNGYEHRLARWDSDERHWVVSTVSDGPFTSEKPWISYSDGVLRYYTMLASDHELYTGNDDIFLLTSTDLGLSWSDPMAITDGLDIQRPVGTAVDGVDYLYLPSTSAETLYFATVSGFTVPEPSSLGVVALPVIIFLHRRRNTASIG